MCVHAHGHVRVRVCARVCMHALCVSVALRVEPEISLNKKGERFKGAMFARPTSTSTLIAIENMSCPVAHSTSLHIVLILAKLGP